MNVKLNIPQKAKEGRKTVLVSLEPYEMLKDMAEEHNATLVDTLDGVIRYVHEATENE
jgi:hypothetical protein